MINYLKYFSAYISLLILWVYVIAILLSIFEIINFDRGSVSDTTIICAICGYIS